MSLNTWNCSGLQRKPLASFGISVFLATVLLGGGGGGGSCNLSHKCKSNFSTFKCHITVLKCVKLGIQSVSSKGTEHKMYFNNMHKLLVHLNIMCINSLLNIVSCWRDNETFSEMMIFMNHFSIWDLWYLSEWRPLLFPGFPLVLQFYTSTKHSWPLWRKQMCTESVWQIQW